MKTSLSYRIITKILGLLLYIEVFFMLIAAFVGWFYDESVAHTIIITSIITFIAATIFYIIGWNAKKYLSKCDGMFVVTMAWIIFSVFGALPYYLSGYIPSYTNAFFETMSGFTTTGASILTDIERLPHALLFWRSLTHWLGGMGFVVFTVALLPLFKNGGSQLFLAESSGPTFQKIHPRIAYTAQKLWIIYLFLTLLESFLLSISGMSLFDAICHSFATMSSGGFSTKNNSLAFWETMPIIHYIVIIFMIFSGINFTLLYYLCAGKLEKLRENEEFRWFVGMIVGFSLLFTGVLFFNNYAGLEKCFRDASFQVTSIMTTTGFGTSDYMLWPSALWILLLYLMVCGGSAGSTNGGLKTIRVVIGLKKMRNEYNRMLHPNAVIPLRMNNRIIPNSLTDNILIFIMTYFIIIIISVVILNISGLPYLESLGATITSLSGVGPAVGKLGPSYNYANIPSFSKWFMSFLMLIGRLEFFTVLLLFNPAFWRRR